MSGFFRELISVKEVVNDGMYQGKTLKFTGPKPTANAKKNTSNIITSFENRFPLSPIIDALEITVFRSWPSVRSDSSGYKKMFTAVTLLKKKICMLLLLFVFVVVLLLTFSLSQVSIEHFLYLIFHFSNEISNNLHHTLI